MSTILDALRKVEEARRMKTTDVRARLLTGSSRFNLRQVRHKRLSWLVVAGLILSGIIVGTGVGRWKEPQPSGGVPSSGAGTPAVAPLPEQGRPQSMAKATAPIPPNSGPAISTQVAPADRPPPRIAATPFYPDPASGVPARPIPSPVPPPPSPMVETPVSSAPVPPPVAQVAPADRPPPPPPRIAATPFYPDPASGIPPRPIPPAPNVPQREMTNVPVAPGERRNILDRTQTDYPNFPRADLPGWEEKLRERLSKNPVQRSPFVSTPESERAVTATPKPTPTAPSSATKPAQIAKAPSVEPPPTPLENEPIAETTSPPTSASLSFLQWSPEPERRIAFIKIGDGPTTLAHEGDTVNGVTIVRIRQEAVDLQSGDSRWTLRTR